MSASRSRSARASSGRRDPREPGPRARRSTRSSDDLAVRHTRRLPRPPVRPPARRRGDPGRGRGRGRRVRPVLPDVLDLPRPARSLPRRPVRAARVPGPRDRQGADGVASRRRAVERGCGRLEWAVLDWNAPAIAFYESLGAPAARRVDGYRIDDEPLARLAAPRPGTTTEEDPDRDEPLLPPPRRRMSGYVSRANSPATARSSS